MSDPVPYSSSMNDASAVPSQKVTESTSSYDKNFALSAEHFDPPVTSADSKPSEEQNDLSRHGRQSRIEKNQHSSRSDDHVTSTPAENNSVGQTPASSKESNTPVDKNSASTKDLKTAIEQNTASRKESNSPTEEIPCKEQDNKLLSSSASITSPSTHARVSTGVIDSNSRSIMGRIRGLNFKNIVRPRTSRTAQVPERAHTWPDNLRNKVSFRWQKDIKIDDLSSDDIIIALMGPTGSGKSSFISKLIGSDQHGVGHHLQSCTNEVSMIKLHYTDKSDLDVIFVDTPGFDDTTKSDTEILEMISNWLKSTFERKIKLAGILYLHRITDNRMAGTPLKNLRMFQKLCGEDALKNVILVTTMWDELDDGTLPIGEKREEELKSNYWKSMLEQGSQAVRYKNSTDSAWFVVENFLSAQNERYATELQEEIVDMKKELGETRAGLELVDTLEKLVRKQRAMLKQIRQETQRADTDDEALAALRGEFERVRTQLEEVVTQIEVLKVPIGKRLLHMWKYPLGLIRRS